VQIGPFQRIPMDSPETIEKESEAATTGPAALLPAHPGLKSILGFLLAWGFLNILLTLNYPLPEKHLLSPLRLSPEVLFIVGGLGIAASLRVPPHWSLYSALTALILFFRLFRIADELVPIHFFRPFNLYIDSQFLPVLVHLLYKTMPAKTFITRCLLSLGLMAAVGTGVWWSIKNIHRFFAGFKKGSFILGSIMVFSGILPFFLGAAANSRPAIFHKGFYYRIIQEIDFIFHVKGYRTQKLQAIKTTTHRLEQTPSSLDKLAGANVYLFFVESYGHTIFEDNRHFRLIEPKLRQYEKELSAQGFSVASGFLKSPTFGGSSWLAHGTIASGVALSSQLSYDLLITSDARTIAHLFNRAGYRTVSVMPANEWPWPGEKFFGYQKLYVASDFEYKGPKFGWSPMPDQFVLHYIYRKEISEHFRPLFIEFVLISSHAPFTPQPPYLENWSQIGDGRIYHQKEAVTFPVVWPDLTNASRAYVTSIIYEIGVLKNFITQFIKDDTLIIIMGDHQPSVQITGPGSSWSVPVHAISRNERFLEPLKNRGYIPGLIPGQPPPHPGMETFLLHFLKSFSSPKRSQ
jgi:Sulfatase